MKTAQCVYEVVLPRRVKAQPVPYLQQHGDCGACVLGGIADVEIVDIYSKYFRKIDNMSWNCIRSVLYELERDNKIDRSIIDVPVWVPYEANMTWGITAWTISDQWYRYVRMAIDAKYYGIATISLYREGPLSNMNHAVMICGVRELRIPIISEDGSKNLGFRYDYQVLISCSARRTDEWMNIIDFLSKCGGYNVLFARPTCP